MIVMTCCSAVSSAQRVSDGDTIKLGPVTYRLWGIDAPELAQVCEDGWPAGRLAAARVLTLLEGKFVDCIERDRDKYGRTVAICRANGVDVGAVLVREGLAWAFVRYSDQYAADEQLAKQKKLGIHGRNCMPAWEWRAARKL